MTDHQKQQTSQRTPEIKFEEIEGGETIGTGSFGKVLRGKCRGKDVAIKILHKPITDEENLASFKREVAIMSNIFHPNICLFMGACTQPGHFFIVQEYMPGGDVEKLLRNPDNKISLLRRLQMAKDAALGVNWLHLNNPAFIHRDLKSSNLLIDANGTVKVCDFGLAQVKPQGQNLQDDDLAKGTPLWMAPEVMQFREFNEKADVYSFGIVLWEFLTRKEPFSHHTNYSKFRKAVCEYGERPEIPPETEPSFRYLIEKCWHPNPEERPSFKSIIQSLDHVIVDVAVKDKIGRKFWKRYFLGHTTAEWSEFAKNLRMTLQIPENKNLSKPDQQRVDLNFQCMESLLAKPQVVNLHKSEIIVELEHFGQIVEWFGPISIGEGEATITPTNRTFMDSVREVLEQPWFHGDIETNQAQERLSGKPPGTFLIRFSSQNGWYTISQINNQRVVTHQRVKHEPGGPFFLGNETTPYESLHELVRKKNLNLPCSGSRFSSLFQEEKPEMVYINCT